jgi:hypothetical protein
VNSFALVSGGVAASTGARPEQPNRVWRVGMLHVVPDQASLGFTAFRKKLAEFGYVEGQNIVFEYRWSQKSCIAASTRHSITLSALP